ASACGCSIFAEANTSARVPPAISSLSVPEGPYLASTFCPDAASNALATSVKALRRLPAACKSTRSEAFADVSMARRMITAGNASPKQTVVHHLGLAAMPGAPRAVAIVGSVAFADDDSRIRGCGITLPAPWHWERTAALH